MKSHSPHSALALRPGVAWAGAAVVSLGALFGFSSAMAAPPANALIGNQATASYADGSGATQASSSNLVQSQVQQVGSFTLDSVSQTTTTVVNTKTGGAGNIVYASHTLTNTGNGADSFTIAVTNGPNGTAGATTMAIYADADGNGLPDNSTPLSAAQTVAGNGGVFKFVVAYTIPASATAPTTPYSSGTVTATPSTSGLYTAPNTTASDVDNVNLTTLAAFNSTLSLANPVVAGPGNSAWPAATQNGQRSSAACTATYAAAQSPAAGCFYTTYTLNFSNTGGAAGVFYANNVLPAGLTYVTGSAVWSGAPGVAMSEGAGGDPTGIDFVQSGQTVSARVANLSPNAFGTISFMVQVNSTASVGTGATTDVATFDAVTSTHATADSTAGTTNTNGSAFTVTATYGVVLGSATGTSAASADTTPGTPLGAAGTAGADQNVASSIVSGSSLRFTQTVFNTGNAADTFNLSVTGNTFPAGTTFSFFKADGSAALIDTNGDGLVDAGSIAAGGSSTFLVQAQIPGTVVSGGPFALTVRATSAGDATKFDASGDQVTAVAGIMVDLTNTAAGSGSGSVGSGDKGAGPSPSPTVASTTPAGTGSIFTLFIKNNDTQANTYNLAVSQTASFPGSLPAGWTVKFVAAGTTCSGTAVATPVSVAAGAQLQIDACVTPAASSAAVTTSVYFRVISAAAASTGATVSDILYDQLTVTAASTYTATLTPNNNGQVSPSGSVVYAHTLNNIGAQACGAYLLGVSNTATGWSGTIYQDNNNNGVIDAGDTVVSSGTSLAVGGSVKYLVRVFAAGSAAAGQTNTSTLVASFTDAAPNCGAPSASDVSTVVVGGQIRAVKTQAMNASCNGTPDSGYSAVLIPNAKPGNCLMYQVVATNQGVGAVSNLVISDAVPNYTALAGATQPAVTCVASASVTGSPVYAVSGTTVSCGPATSVPPNGTLTLTFAVKIAP